MRFNPVALFYNLNYIQFASMWLLSWFTPTGEWRAPCFNGNGNTLQTSSEHFNILYNSIMQNEGT